MALGLEHEEQQSVDALKSFWRTHGNRISLAILLAALAYVGYVGWNAWQNSRMNKGAAAYEVLQAAVVSKQAERVLLAWQDLRTGFGGMQYADLGALLAARALHDAGKPQEAEQALRWAIEHGNDRLFQDMARLRLSALLVDQNKLDDALKLVNDMDAKEAPLRSLGADRRGDILALQGKRDEARAAYQIALDAMPKNAPIRDAVVAKFVAVGGSAPAVVLPGNPDENLGPTL